MPKVTIGTTEVYLATKDLPEFAYSLNSLTDPAKMRGSRSTTFNVPATNGARQVLGGPSLVEEAPSVQDFRIGDGGIVLFEGKCSPVEWTEDGIQILAVGDNAGWMNAAKGTKITDLDLGSSPTVTDSYQRQTWTDLSTTDAYPLIDYGGLEDRTASYNVTTQELRPALRVWKILDKFFQREGYSVKATGGFSRIWKRLILPNTTDKINGDAAYLASKSVRLDMASGYSYTGNTEVPTDTITSDPAGIATATTITPIVGTRYRVTLGGNINITRDSANQPRRIILFVYDNTAAVTKLQRIVEIPQGTLNETVSLSNFVMGEFDIISGHEYEVRFTVFNAAFNHTITVDRWSVEWDMIQADYIEGITLDLNTCAPKMTIADLISGMVNIPRLIVSTDDLTHTVTFGFLEDYLKEPVEGIDWRTRIDHTKPPQKVQPEVPSAYEFRYKDDKGDAYLVEFANREDRGFGETDYVTGGADKPVRIEVPFAATWMDVRLDFLTIPCMKKEGPYYQQNFYEYEPRLLIMAELAPGDWTHDGTFLNSYPRTYFVGGNAGDVSLSFASETVTGNATEGSVATRWRDYLRRAVAPYLRADVRVYDDEFMGFEFGRPRLIHDGYHQVWCYVQEVKGKRFGEDEPVECELIPI